MTFDQAVAYFKEIGEGSLLDGLECIEEAIAADNALPEEEEAFNIVVRGMRPLFFKISVAFYPEIP
jgi:hypothetical protein